MGLSQEYSSLGNLAAIPRAQLLLPAIALQSLR